MGDVAGAERRRWVLAPVVAEVTNHVSDHDLRTTTPADDALLARLLDDSYRGSIDFEEGADHLRELRTWRTQDGADDDASFIALAEGAPIAASLIATELGAPFLYEVATTPSHRRCGLARAVVTRSLAVLAARETDLVAAWVTFGNVPSERLLGSLGFTPVTPPLQRPVALGLYRAAHAVRLVDASPTAALAVTPNETGPTLWVVEHGRPSTQVEVAGTGVRVEFVAATDPRIEKIANEAVPLRRAEWLLSHRQAPH